jgi:OmpA-OmpF porin, OOP family
MSQKLGVTLCLIGLLLLFILCPWKHWSEISAMQGGSRITPAGNSNTNTNINSVAKLEMPTFKVASENGKYRLVGILPDEASKQQLIAKAKEVYGEGNYIDELKVGNVSKPTWLASAISLLPFTKNGVMGGGLTAEGASLTLVGQVPSEADKTRVFAEASKALSPTTVNNLLTVAGQKALTAEEAKTQVKLNEVIAGKIIEFETGSDKLTAKGTAVLDEMIPTLKGSSDNLQIEGHTDNAGNASKNLDLSKRRSESVKRYLTEKGLDAQRFTPVGFGQEKPIADNSTAEGKQRNRRIEFQVKGGK